MKNYLDVLNEATELAMKDLGFRKKLLEDANKAIKEKFNEDLPTKVIFHESDPKHLVFVLPLKEKIVQNVEELDEDSLESVAGGKSSGDDRDISMRTMTSNVMAYACFPDMTSSNIQK